MPDMKSDPIEDMSLQMYTNWQAVLLEMSDFTDEERKKVYRVLATLLWGPDLFKR